MRMNDYEWEFTKDSIDKKNVAHSARNARTHCGKSGSVRFPSDNLTKKELKAMSGEVISYASLKKPMNFEEFKALPVDLKREYIAYIRDQFSAPDKYIAEMFGVSSRTMGIYFADNDISGGLMGKKNWAKDSFYAWRSGADMNAAEPPVYEPVEDVSEENIEEYTVDITNDKSAQNAADGSREGFYERVCAVPMGGSMRFNCSAEDALNTMKMLLGTTNVRMEITWSVVPDFDDAE